VRVLGPNSLSISGVSRINPDGVNALCIVYLGSQSLAVVRYSVRRLRKRFPGVPIVVCLWGSVDLGPMTESAQAEATINSLSEAVAFAQRRWLPSECRKAPLRPFLSPLTEVELPWRGRDELCTAQR